MRSSRSVVDISGFGRAMRLASGCVVGRGVSVPSGATLTALISGSDALPMISQRHAATMMFWR